MISMADIAEEAQVSRTTVSLVLNDRHIKGVNISENTRHRIKEIAVRRGYRQNALASSMAKGRSRLIGCLRLDLSEEVALYLGQIMTAAVKTATEQDYSLKLLSSELTVDQLVEECFGYRMSGVIIRSRDRKTFDQLHQQLGKYQIPVVLVDTDFDRPGVTSVNSDDTDGMKQAVAHLVELGHRRLEYISIEDFNPFTVVRKKGFLAAAQEFGLPVGEESCHSTDTSELRPPYERTEELAMQLLASAERPTAIVCNSDEIAMLVLRAAWRSGIKVPEDLSVVGFGNLPLGGFACPALTSLDRPYGLIGNTAIEQLINHPTECRSIRLPVELVIRQSSGPCPQSNHSR